MLRGALVGLGNIAVRGHVAAFRSDPWLLANTEIVAVADIGEGQRESAREHLPGARFYTNVERMFAEEQFDFADICTPPHSHAGLIRACAAKRIHVLCEKPLTDRHAASASLGREVRGSGIVFVPCHQYRYSPLWESIRSTIASGGIGRVTLAQFNVFRMQADKGTAAWNPEWRTDKSRSGGGILADTGAHYLYLVQLLFGVPRRVSAVITTLKHGGYGVEDTALATLEYEGALVQINLTWAAGGRANSAVVAGIDGTLAYDGSTLRHVSAGGSRDIPMPDVSDKSQYVSWYASLFREFADRVERNDTSDDLLSEAETVMKLLDACYLSAERGSAVDVP